MLRYLLLPLFPFLLNAQDNSCMRHYQSFMTEAKMLADGGKYKEALNAYNAAAVAALDCGQNKDAEINDAINQIFVSINKIKEEAILSRKMADDRLIDVQKANAIAEKRLKEAQEANATAEKRLEEVQTAQKSEILAKMNLLLMQETNKNLADRANALVNRLGGEQSYAFFMQQGISHIKREILAPVPEFGLAEQYFAIALFSKENDPEAQQWLDRFDLLSKGYAAYSTQNLDLAKKYYTTLVDTDSILGLYAYTKRAEIDSFQALSQHKNLTWEKIKQAYTAPESHRQLDWQGQIVHGRRRILAILPEDAFSGFKNAQKISLYLNHLSFLPESICDLENLDSLVISSNKLRSLPPNIGQLKSLAYLKAGNNLLYDLPESFGSLRNLDYLELHNNYFSKIPVGLLNLDKLLYLDLAQNRIDNLSSDFFKGSTAGALLYLNLEKNRLQNIPIEIKNLTALRFLDLSNNELRVLPLELYQLKSLEVLDLSENPDLQINFALLHSQLPNLKELYLYNIKNLNEESLNRLKKEREHIRVKYKQ